jgi:hypothetical protein
VGVHRIGAIDEIVRRHAGKALGEIVAERLEIGVGIALAAVECQRLSRQRLRRCTCAGEQRDGKDRCDKKRRTVSGLPRIAFPPPWPRNEQCPPHIVKHRDFTPRGTIVAVRMPRSSGGRQQSIHVTELICRRINTPVRLA